MLDRSTEQKNYGKIMEKELSKASSRGTRAENWRGEGGKKHSKAVARKTEA